MTISTGMLLLTVRELREALSALPDGAVIGLACEGSTVETLDALHAVTVVAVQPSLLVLGPPPADAGRLFEAVSQGDQELVRKLLADGADVNARDPRSPMFDGATPLILAADAGPTDMLRVLLGAGADVNARSASGWTALMRASNAGATEAARLLLDAGADPRLINNEGYTARGRVPGTSPELKALLDTWEATQPGNAPGGASRRG
ncbi:ankyrin repeat domain-containing protein [Sorangium sp. So ce1000]|uniref:ankyrin repeat domain-containing protein n=1 Tax=Sorangium sp. So ce1000 TaxID=3133325 RepID=UPI003F5FBCE9